LILVVLLISLAVAAATGCNDVGDARRRVSARYNPSTGRLQLLTYDSNGNGRVDMWGHMEGTRVVRIDIDKDEDGRIERWEHYGPDNALLKVGFSRTNDGIENAWIYGNPDGTIARIEVSTRRNGTIDRVERYERNALKEAEEDTDGNGRLDKWEAYDNGRLASISLDTKGRGKPDRRVIYPADGGEVTVEVDTAGNGHFARIHDP
jgi:hypothetical protein